MKREEDKSLSITEMMEMSYELWNKNKEKWSPMEPEYGKNFILYMIEELGEAIAIIKKKKEEEIMNNEKVRERFIEEMGDVLMYFIDTLNRYHISPEEFSRVYKEKFYKNMKRDFTKQYKEYI